MADLEQISSTPKRRVLRSVILSFLFVVVFISAALTIMFSTDRGSKFLLDRVLEQQDIINYQYESGNLLRGIILKNILISLPDVDVKADSAEISLGWRAILQKEIHLRYANMQKLQVITKSPKTDEPFQFKPIALPFVLRLDQAKLDYLLIKHQQDQSGVEFHDIRLKDALWRDTDLSFKQTDLDMGYLSVKNAQGKIRFTEKYPLQATGQVHLPSLKNSVQIDQIYLVVRGSLDTLQAGLATQTPDLLTGWIQIHPVRDHVPMQGALNFKRYHLPFLAQQKLFIEQGIAKVNGNTEGLNIQLNTTLSGQDIPKGQYQATMYTDFVNQLQFKQFTGQLMGGEVQLTGKLDWEKDFSWDVIGRVENMLTKNTILPEIARDFLPQQIDANIASQGSIADQLQVKAKVDFDQNEKWQLQLTQKEKQPLTMLINWAQFNREIPYVGWLNSPKGQVNLNLTDKKQTIALDTIIATHEKSLLPQGQYQTNLILQNNRLKLSNFALNSNQGQLSAQAQIDLPTTKTQLKWSAQLNAKNFNPQQIAMAAPIDLLNGRIMASGYAKPNQQIIQLNSIDLSGRLPQQTQTVQLTGRSTAALLFHDAKKGDAFKSFAVNYDGALKTDILTQGNGKLKLSISGTPTYLNIAQFSHTGVAGNIRANGAVNLEKGAVWKMNAALSNFKPQYFTSLVQGDLSGQVQSAGIWSDQIKRIELNNLNVAGTLNHKPLRATGNLALILKSTDHALVPQHFKAQRLLLAYANNQIQADGDGNHLKVKVNAPNLNEVYQGLKGRISGVVDVKIQPHLNVIANLSADNLSYNQLVTIQKISLKGQLPTSENTPTLLRANLTQLRSGQREIRNIDLSIAGTRKAHLLKLNASNRLSQFYVQLAGGFNTQNDWLGQIQKGNFDSYRTNLVQENNASVFYSTQKNELFVSAHCWMNKESRLCFDQPVVLSKVKGDVSFAALNLNLSDFAAFMPAGFVMTGKLNGFAKAAWNNGKKPKIDINLNTRYGTIGVSDEEENDISSTLPYERIALLAKSVTDGLQVRLDVNTKEIGAGYANVIIDPYSANKNMRGEFAFAKMNLKVFKPFIKDARRLEGTLSFAGKINGALTQPLVTGDLRLKDGAISLISLPVDFNNIQVYSAIRENNATIQGAFNSGRGVAKLTGKIDWANVLRVQLNLKGEKLLIRQAPSISALVSPDLALDVYPTQKTLSLTGEILVPRAVISMPEASKPVVSVSPDARIIYQGQDPNEILRVARPWKINTNIMVQLGQQVIFQAFDSRIPLLGRLYLTQQGTQTTTQVNGAIGVSQPVRIEAYGQTLELTRAIARFSGPMENPSLDIDLNKNVQGNLIGARILGTVNSPKIQIYNDAGLNEQEALNALLSGRINEGSSATMLNSAAGFKSDVSNSITAAGISLGLGGTRKLTNQIGAVFGLSNLSLGAQGTGDDTQVSLTGYITPDLFIRYGVGVFTPVNTLTLRYQMNRRLYMEASQSLERALDFFYNWRY